MLEPSYSSYYAQMTLQSFLPLSYLSYRELARNDVSRLFQNETELLHQDHENDMYYLRKHEIIHEQTIHEEALKVKTQEANSKHVKSWKLFESNTDVRSHGLMTSKLWSIIILFTKSNCLEIKLICLIKLYKILPPAIDLFFL